MIKKLVGKFRGTSENNRIVIVNIIGAMAVKGLALVISLFTMPAYMRFFGDETALGLWFTVVSVLNWILNFDLGIGNGLRNHLTEALAKKDYSEAKKYLSSAYVSVGAICLLLSVTLFVAFGFVNWNAVFSISTDIVSPKAMLWSVRIVFIGIILQMFFKLITSVLYAIQKSSLNNFLHLCATAATLAAVLIIPSADNDKNMIIMAIVHSVTSILPFVIASVVIFSGKTLRKVLPSIRCFRKSHTKAVLSLGGMFLVIQLAYMVIMNTNEYLISFLSSNEDVVDYQIYHRLFALGSTVFALMLTPIWSAVTKATAERNVPWVKSLYKKLLLIGAAVCACEFLLVPFLQVAVNLWLGDEAIPVNPTYGLVFAALGSALIISSVFSNIANGLGKLKVQLICFVSGALIKPLLAWGAVALTSSWIGVIIANIICILIYCIIQPLWLQKYFRKEEDKSVSVFK